MKKLIWKSLLFITPFFILFLIKSLLYSESEYPDLLRIGYIPNIYKNYRAIFPIIEKEKFVNLSNSKKKKYKIMTIGDSFSEQGTNGYKNFLANDFSVLHVDRFISQNQIQTLIGICNGDFFDDYKIEYVILQNVERYLMDNICNINNYKKLNISSIDSILKAPKKEIQSHKYDFFSRKTIEFPLYNFPKFFLDRNYLSDESVYNFDLITNNVFSNSSNKLLFLSLDPLNTKRNNELENCQKLNTVLNNISNKLRKRKIKLIFLPSPDKYDLYYDLINEKNGLPKPIFYDNFKSLKKEYLYIDSKSILSKYIHKKKDLYYYDDAHWSPIAAKIIAAEIKKTINNN